MVYEQPDLFGGVHVFDTDPEPIDLEENFDVCPVCGNSPCTCEEDEHRYNNRNNLEE